MMPAREWQYEIEYRDAQLRSYPGGNAPRGITWSLLRICTTMDGELVKQDLVTSPEVFVNHEDAKEDAIKKFAILSCPVERPIAQTFKWLLDGI